MASPWASTRQPAIDRPWVGMAVMGAVPVFSLVLVRLFWSGSSLWFITAGFILLGAAAVAFLARRNGDAEYARETAAPDTSRLPLVLTGIGVLFLAMLILPNFAGGSSSPDIASPGVVQSEVSQAPVSDTAGVSQAPAQESIRRVVPQESFVIEPEVTSSESTYVVQEGDTLWDIALLFDSSVESIVEANGLEDETAISIDQELVIPAGGGDETATRGG